jgi:hypothetical protein
MPVRLRAATQSQSGMNSCGNEHKETAAAAAVPGLQSNTLMDSQMPKGVVLPFFKSRLRDSSTLQVGGKPTLLEIAKTITLAMMNERRVSTRGLSSVKPPAPADSATRDAQARADRRPERKASAVPKPRRRQPCRAHRQAWAVQLETATVPVPARRTLFARRRQAPPYPQAHKVTGSCPWCLRV